MGRLMVITVPPDVGTDQYRVILGDCVLPGHVLSSHAAQHDADESCRYFADHYNLTAYPLFMPWKRRTAFVLLQGGKS